MSNWEEYVADTSPQDSTSILFLSGTYAPAESAGETGRMLIAFSGSSNRFYQLEYGTNFTSQSVGVLYLGRGTPSMTVTNDSPGRWSGIIRVFVNEPNPVP